MGPPPFLCLNLSLEEKGHGGVGGLPAGSSVFVKEPCLLLQPLPKSAAEETALVLDKSRSHQGSSRCSQVGLGAQRRLQGTVLEGTADPKHHTWDRCGSLVVCLWVSSIQ